MFYLLHSVTTTDIFKRQLPPLLLAFVIAELFYKFHSFALECGAFLITWYAIDAVAHWGLRKRRSPKDEAKA
jgi:hypothetical protein